MGPHIVACSMVIGGLSRVTNHKYNKTCNSLFYFLAESWQYAADFLLICQE